MFRFASVARLRQALPLAALVTGFVLPGPASAQSDPPAAPAIEAVHPGDEALTVVWEAPSEVSDITAYDVRYIQTRAGETDDSNWTVEEDVWAGGPRHHVLTGLTNDFRYDVQVRAVTDTDGAWSATVAGIPAEPGDERATAVDLPLEVPVGGVISMHDDVDVFRFTLSRETGLLLFTRGDLDSVGTLENENGQAIAYNDDGNYEGGPYNFLIAAVLDAGTYYLAVESHGRRTGSYTVQSEPSVDTTGIDDAQAVAVDVVYHGRIDPGGDEDYFQFSLSEETDLVLRYSFHVETVTEPGSAIAHAASLRFGELGAGRIDPSTDADYFRIDLYENSASHVVVQAVSNTVDIDGALLDANGDAVDANVFQLMHDLVANCSALTAPFSDPLSGCQWHLKNSGQLGGTSGEDIRVEDVWAGGNMGAGIGVAVVDHPSALHAVRQVRIGLRASTLSQRR